MTNEHMELNELIIFDETCIVKSDGRFFNRDYDPYDLKNNNRIAHKKIKLSEGSELIDYFIVKLPRGSQIIKFFTSEFCISLPDWKQARTTLEFSYWKNFAFRIGNSLKFSKYDYKAYLMFDIYNYVSTELLDQTRFKYVDSFILDGTKEVIPTKRRIVLYEHLQHPYEISYGAGNDYFENLFNSYLAENNLNKE